MPETPATNPTACLLVIGNEVLSGRTRDANIHFIAGKLSGIGMRLLEVRVIPDVPEVIVRTVNEARARFDHVLTTGGIGPTHDDITAECISAAFGVPWVLHPEAYAMMSARYAPGEFNAARQRMATMPAGATLIANAASSAPGFTIGNVHVMAGVPRIMQAMMDTLLPTLPHGATIHSRAVHATGLLEGLIAAGLSAIQDRHPGIDIGSYPYDRPDTRGVSIVAKGTNLVSIEGAIDEVAGLMRGLKLTPVMGEPPAA